MPLPFQKPLEDLFQKGANDVYDLASKEIDRKRQSYHVGTVPPAELASFVIRRLIDAYGGLLDYVAANLGAPESLGVVTDADIVDFLKVCQTKAEEYRVRWSGKPEWFLKGVPGDWRADAAYSTETPKLRDAFLNNLNKLVGAQSEASVAPKAASDLLASSEPTVEASEDSNTLATEREESSEIPRELTERADRAITSEIRRLKKNLNERLRAKKQEMAARGRLGFGPDWKEMLEWFVDEFTARGAAVSSAYLIALEASDECSEEGFVNAVHYRINAEFTDLLCDAETFFATYRQMPTWYKPRLVEEASKAVSEAVQLLRADLRNRAEDAIAKGLKSEDPDEREFFSVKLTVEGRLTRKFKEFDARRQARIDKASGYPRSAEGWNANYYGQIFCENLHDRAEALAKTYEEVLGERETDTVSEASANSIRAHIKGMLDKQISGFRATMSAYAEQNGVRWPQTILANAINDARVAVDGDVESLLSTLKRRSVQEEPLSPQPQGAAMAQTALPQSIGDLPTVRNEAVNLAPTHPATKKDRTFLYAVIGIVLTAVLTLVGANLGRREDANLKQRQEAIERIRALLPEVDSLYSTVLHIQFWPVDSTELSDPNISLQSAKLRALVDTAMSVRQRLNRNPGALAADFAIALGGAGELLYAQMMTESAGLVDPFEASCRVRTAKEFENCLLAFRPIADATTKNARGLRDSIRARLKRPD
jgi:hypothetical protein